MHLRFEDKHVQEHLVYVGRTAPRSHLRAELRHALTMAMAEDLCATHFTYNESRPAYDEGAVLRARRTA